MLTPSFELISDRTRRIGNLSTSFTSIPHQALLDHHRAHVSLGNLECHWKLFNRQLTRTQQFLRSLDQHPSAPKQLLTTLQLELSNIQDIYKSSETTITSGHQSTKLPPTTDQHTMQKKLIAFPRNHPQLAYGNHHY